jgi:hypothetical protein
MRPRSLAISEIVAIVMLALIPLFVNFPYRVNIFLSWEGAFRMSQGQLPFRDFGIPLGGMYWVIPAVFFKLFGSKLITLVKAQVFLNIIAGLSFRSILRSSSIQPVVRFLSVLLFCVSYSFFNFWPWYNHTVIVYELVGLSFLLKYFFHPTRKSIVWLFLSAFFIACSFLTKQDGGALAFLIALSLLFYNGLVEKKWISVILFPIIFLGFIALTALIFSSGNFGYWFNHGQPPHSSRISLSEISEEFLSTSQWIKFYLFLICFLIVIHVKKWRAWLDNKQETFFLLLTLGILLEAAIFQVTSYTPPDNNIFFHSFAFACVFMQIYRMQGINFNGRKVLLVGVLGILIWWSGSYWKYIQRVTGILNLERVETISASGENVINRNTYARLTGPADSTAEEPWVLSGLKTFDKIYIPKSTADGMHRLLNLELLKKPGGLRVLNMSELTPLAAEVPFSLERNKELPLWYHLGVAMFNRQAMIYENRIKEKYYDLVIFENIPNLNNFYPFRVRDSLKLNYRLIDSFAAPRRGDTQGQIEIYVKPSP